jgi:hypothetical protein
MGLPRRTGEGIPAARIAREAGLSRQRVHEIVKPRSAE